MSEPTGKVFELRAVADFLDVPVDRLGECVSDFAEWCKWMGLSRSVFNPETIRSKTDVFQWKDDGMRGISSVTFNAVEKFKDSDAS